MKISTLFNMSGSRRRLLIPALAAITAGLSFQGSQGRDLQLGQSVKGAHVDIVRTAFGVPHIKATDYRSLGYGVGYAYAEDNVCLLAEMLITVRGERSRYFGPQKSPSWGGPSNIDGDAFYRSYLDPDSVARLYKGISTDAAALADGYAAGYNRYLADTPPGKRPHQCRDASWVTSATAKDVYLLLADKMISGSMGSLQSDIVSASPPASDAEPEPHDPQPAEILELSPPGSNGYALGRDLAANGTGILVANPHFPWGGPNRFYQMHLTIPGQLNVMGASIPPFPVVVIGFNEDVAWTHTVSTGKRKTFYELALSPDDPTVYIYDGRPEKLTVKEVPVDVLTADGTVKKIMKRTYWSRFGPIVAKASGQLAWTRQHTYAVRDAMLENTRTLDQWLAIGRSQDVASLHQALLRWHGTPWVNTIAADRAGNAFYADMSVVPNVPDERLAACLPSTEAQVTARKADIVILDGSRRDCDWKSDAAAQNGIIPAREMPALVRSDYVMNSNDSFWLANAEHPLTGFPSVIGKIDEPQNLRTRMGHKQLGELFRSRPGAITVGDMGSMILGNRNYAAESVLDDILDICDGAGGSPTGNIAAGCNAMRHWDRRDDPASEGAVVFRELWFRILGLRSAKLWLRAFDPKAPLDSPGALAKADPDVARTILQAIDKTVVQLHEAGLPPDVSLGEVQGRDSTAGRIPVGGGTGAEGVLNLMAFGALGHDGYANDNIGGSSYLQVVTWDTTGPVARGLLAYGQSSEPDSLHYSDQTLLFLAKILPRQPFTDAEIERTKVSETSLSE